MPKVTIFTSRLNDRDKKSAHNELIKGNTVCIHPTCFNSTRSTAILEESREFFESLGATELKQEESEYPLWILDPNMEVLKTLI